MPHQKQRLISRKIIEAEENERNRLGAELHDNINQLLVTARLYIGLERKKQTANSEFLSKADDHLEMAIAEIRDLTRRLTTAAITTEGVQKCILEIAANMFQLKAIRLEARIDNETNKKLSAEQQIMVYRIIQEQTNNILKYAETKTAEISLQQKDNEVELIITDKGKGFEKTEQKLNGIGFVNILHRVEAFNGSMELYSSPGKGCRLKVRFPLNET